MQRLILSGVSSAAIAQDAVAYSRGYKRSEIAKNGIFEVAELSAEDIASAPDSIDWSQQGATSAVHDQGTCGSCWAFSTMQTVESAVYMSTGKLPEPLSVQELVACDKSDAGCRGGDVPGAVEYLKTKGMSSEANYPDTSSTSGKRGFCTWNKQSVVAVSGMKYAITPCSEYDLDCSGQDEDALAAALAKYGPLAICINSGDHQTGDWMKYSSGVLSGSCKADYGKIDHCVQLVGYDKTGSEPYWKIKNSWGTSFGEKGFIRIPYGSQNSCCVGCEAVIISASETTVV